jgi:RAT1-interacting protein
MGYSLSQNKKEFASFSYDENHQFHLGDRSLRWYYPPRLGLDLSEGYETFVKQDDTVDEHLDTLLEAIAAHEQSTMQRIDAHVITWRGVLTKVWQSLAILPFSGLDADTHQVMSAPYDDRDG